MHAFCRAGWLDGWLAQPPGFGLNPFELHFENHDWVHKCSLYFHHHPEIGCERQILFHAYKYFPVQAQEFYFEALLLPLAY